MSPFLCSFCSHANPAGSKFCNECGSPLGFKPCPDCEAVNARDAQACHQCGADLAPRPVPAPDSFEERLDTLRRYVDSLEGTPAAQRLGLLASAARQSSPLAHASPAPPHAALEPAMRHEPTAPAPADTPEPARAPVILGASPEVLRPTLASSVEPEPLRPAPEISSAAVPPSGAALGEPALAEFAAAPIPELAPPDVVSPPSRRLSPGFFYAAGLGLIVLGILGYAYSLYGLPAQVEQWIGSVRALVHVSIASIMTDPAPRASPQPDSGTTPAGPEPVKAVVENSPPASMPAAGPAPSTPSPAAPASAATPATTGAESALATAQPAPITAAETSAPPAQPPAPAVAPPTEAKSEAPPAKVSQTRATKKRNSRTASKRADPRKAPSNRSMLAPEELAPAQADTRATAFPGVYSCTSGVAALGLCDPDQRQEAN